MTAEEFTKDDVNRATLASVLKEPILIQALAILKDELEPSADNLAAITNPVISASRFQQVAGANHILKGLQRLTQATIPRKALVGKQLEKFPED
jgi:hypothetical protein